MTAGKLNNERRSPLDYPKVESLVISLWTCIRMDWGFATDSLAEAFRRDRSLGARARRDVSEALFGMIRQARRIDFALDIEGDEGRPGKGARHLAGDNRERARFLAWRVLEDGLKPSEAAERAHGLKVNWESVAAVDGRIAAIRSELRRLALSRSIPDWLAKRLVEVYGDEADALAASLNARAPLTIRVNTLKIDRETLSARLKAEGYETHPGRHGPNALIFMNRVNVFGLKAFSEGLFEVQDEASQLAAEIVAPPPGGLVIDACAGAGGKTLALGGMLCNKGHIVALDVDERKLNELRRRARRAGLSNTRAIRSPFDAVPDEVSSLQGKADRVLVDAPCSGLGALRRNPEARWRLQEEDMKRFPSQQEKILYDAAAWVRPGGRLIYVTCTICPDENERVVERVLSRARDFVIMTPTEIWGKERALPYLDSSGRFLRLLPHRHDTDGFFAAVLRKPRAEP